MTDDLAPYAGAIEETAKTAGKAIDAIRDAVGPIGDVYGILIGDRIHAARQSHLEKLAHNARKRLRERNQTETAPIAEQIAVPLLEAAQGESREELQDLWARLLANAMDPSRNDDVRPELISALRRLQPTDVLVLEKIAAQRSFWRIESLAKEFPDHRQSALELALNSLESAHCVFQPSNSRGAYAVTSTGTELLIACQP